MGFAKIQSAEAENPWVEVQSQDSEYQWAGVEYIAMRNPLAETSIVTTADYSRPAVEAAGY